VIFDSLFTVNREIRAAFQSIFSACIFDIYFWAEIILVIVIMVIKLFKCSL